MRRPRITIASLLGLVVFLGVGLAALRAATDDWDSGVLGVTLGLLLTSVLLVIHRDDGRRAYWLGFALFGWAYFVVSLVPAIEARLPTTRALSQMDAKVNSRSWIYTLAGGIHQGHISWARPATPPVLNTNQGVVRLWDASTGSPLSGPNGTAENFLRIGHSLLALVLAFLGAHLSRYLYASGRPGRSAEEDVVSPSPPRSDDV